MAKEGSIYRKGDYEYQVRGGKAYNFNVPKKAEKKPAPAAKPKAETKADAAPKVEAPAPKKVEATKPPVYTKDQPGSEAEAYRGPVPEKERIRIATAPLKRDLDTIGTVTGFSRVIGGIGRNIANRGLRAVSPKLLEAGKKLIEGPKAATKPTPTGPRRLENANKDQKLLEYKPQPKARAIPKRKPRKPNPEQGSLNYSSGGRINGMAIRGRTKGRMV